MNIQSQGAYIHTRPGSGNALEESVPDHAVHLVHRERHCGAGCCLKHHFVRRILYALGLPSQRSGEQKSRFLHVAVHGRVQLLRTDQQVRKHQLIVSRVALEMAKVAQARIIRHVSILVHSLHQSGNVLSGQAAAAYLCKRPSCDERFQVLGDLEVFRERSFQLAVRGF